MGFLKFQLALTAMLEAGVFSNYSKTCVKRPKNGFQDRLSLNAGQ